MLRAERDDLFERLDSRDLLGEELGDEDFLLNALDSGAISKASLSHLAEEDDDDDDVRSILLPVYEP